MLPLRRAVAAGEALLLFLNKTIRLRIALTEYCFYVCSTVLRTVAQVHLPRAVEAVRDPARLLAVPPAVPEAPLRVPETEDVSEVEVRVWMPRVGMTIRKRRERRKEKERGTEIGIGTETGKRIRRKVAIL